MRLSGFLLLMAVLAGLLAACRPEPAAVAIAVPEVVETAVPASPLPPSATPTVPPPTPFPSATPTASATATATITPTPTETATPTHPLMIELMRQEEYPGSELAIEETLEPGVNYERYIVSYQSDGNKIYALLTVPWGNKPESGWPVILFNHGWIDPEIYRTTERYVDYVDAIARSGYIVLRSDYRGHGSSEGEPESAYRSPAYTADVLNALASVKTYPDADPQRIGMWGHSMGGYITLRSMVVSPDIRAGVIWGGVVASYADMFNGWRRGSADSTPDPTREARRRRGWYDTYGTPEENPAFWSAMSSNSYLADLSGPLQLHHGTADDSVPHEFSETLVTQLEAAGRPGELFLYDGDNHNISWNFWTAMERSIAFFDQYVKRTG